MANSSPAAGDDRVLAQVYGEASLRIHESIARGRVRSVGDILESIQIHRWREKSMGLRRARSDRLCSKCETACVRHFRERV